MVKEPKRQGAIKAPQLPRALPPAELPRDLPEEHETYSQLDYQGLNLAKRVIERLHFETVSFGQLDAAESRLDHLRLEDVRFTGCNLATAAWPNTACVRAEFITCRMTGFTTEDALFHDTIFHECKIDLAQFYQAKMRGVRFEDCLLTGVDFRKADLTGVAFVRCDLSNCDFTGATLTGADLRGCQIDGMRAGPDELRGAIVDEVQALALVRAMGITVM
jgi:uncharacterized protein YjbI with pentapeptide repeats